MVARGGSQTRLKILMAIGGGAIFLILSVVGGVVGWLSRETPEKIIAPEVKHCIMMMFFYYTN